MKSGAEGRRGGAEPSYLLQLNDWRMRYGESVTYSYQEQVWAQNQTRTGLRVWRVYISAGIVRRVGW